MTYKINFEQYKDNFVLPSSVVDDDIRSLDIIYLKVILLIFKNAGKNYSANLLSNLLNCDEDKIKEAISYWIERNVLVPQEVEELNHKAITFSKRPNLVMSTAAKPINGELAFLLECAESLIKRPITSTEHKTIVQIFEFLKLPADVILMAVDYCVSIDKFSANYLEKVCTNWANNNILTHETAEQYLNYLQESKKNENLVKKLFGIGNRTLVESEQKYISRWFGEYQYNIDIIKKAYEISIMKIAKLSFPYINKILANWFDAGYKTLADIQKGEAKPENSIDSSYDIDEIDKFWDNVPKYRKDGE